ncbi:MAG TPA: class I poly(R)-hydroxyalkanoic acid synthase [Thermohalobaculum sp.]|nr:class I poly(R)-hydroxyalkanoic acid synthase [Thermohalobaculum sp.]
MAEKGTGEGGQHQAGEGAALAERIAKIVERSQRIWAESLDRRVEDPTMRNPDPLNSGPAMMRWGHDYLSNPQKAVEAGLDFLQAQVGLWNRMLSGSLGHEKPEPMIRPDKGDKRFNDEIWSDNPFYDYLKQSYLLTGQWLKERLEEAEGLTPQDRRKLALITRNYIDATAPTNMPSLNPEVLKTTIEEGGDNLLRGLEHLLRDLEHGHGQLRIRQTDLEHFKVGENLATTPGKVIFQNEIFQLIQYAPATDQVHARPVLFVPPWINKFYILDLNEKKSLIRWLVAHGHTVLVVSWVNPDEHQRDETWESYMKKGVLTALEKTLEETGADKANVVGYCIGGTMLGTTLAWMAAKGDHRVASATFLTTQLDFSDAGDLQVFADEEVIEAVEDSMGDRGYLSAENMFDAFNSLRSTDLIWGFVVSNYLLGKENFPFDLLFWNSDSTAMPGKVHFYYLRTFYNRNALARGELTVDGERLDLADIKLPCFHVATLEDHIAPADSAYRGARMLSGRRHKFVLAGSGHIAGVVNPPEAEKYQYWTRPGLKPETLEEWRSDAKETPGSWWPDWHRWLARQSDKKVKAREPGKTLGVVEDAPGSYVKVRADLRDD